MLYRFYTFAFSLLAGIGALCVGVTLALGRLSDADLLVYSVSNPDGFNDLWLLEYPSLRTFPITFNNWEAEYGGAWSVNGQLAYVQVWQNSQYQNHCNVRVNGRVINPQPFSSCGELAWSSDGRLAFEASLPDQLNDIYIWDGVTLANWPNNSPYRESAPVWSPEGRLAFISDREGNWEIYVETAQGLINVSRNEQSDWEPHWSEDGQLAFIYGVGVEHPFGPVTIWDGTTQIQIGDSYNYNSSLRWSHDGRLGFLAPEGNTILYIWDGTALQRAIDVSDMLYTSLAWTPDGRPTVVSSRSDDGNIFLWNGSAFERLTAHSPAFGLISDLAWMPRSR